MYVSVTKLRLLDARKSKDLRELEKEARRSGIWGEVSQNGNRVIIAETVDLGGEVHCALLLHGGFPLEIVPPYVGSADLEAVAENLVRFTRSPLEAGVACLASLKLDAGGERRVETPIRALEKWTGTAGSWLDKEARREADVLEQEERAKAKADAKALRAATRAEEARRARMAREAEEARARAEREERLRKEEEEEKKVRAEAIAAWESEQEAKRVEEEARRKALEERRKARAEAKLEEERLRFAMFFIEIASVAELILEQRRASDPLRPLREQGGEVVEVSAEGWEVWEYPVGRYAEVEAGEGSEAGEAGEGSEAGEAGEGGVAVHEVEADLPYILNVTRLHICQDRRAWEDERGFCVVTGDNLSLHLVTDMEIALAILRKEWRVREAQEFRGEGYCRKVRRQDGWDGRLESAVEELG